VLTGSERILSGGFHPLPLKATDVPLHALLPLSRISQRPLTRFSITSAPLSAPLTRSRYQLWLSIKM